MAPEDRVDSADAAPSPPRDAGPTASATVAPPASPAEDGGEDDHNEVWWEEDDEDEEEEGGGARPGAAVAGLNKLWRGTAASRAGTENGGGEGGAAGSRRWIHRREREAPFLRLLVGSQVRPVWRCAFRVVSDCAGFSDMTFWVFSAAQEREMFCSYVCTPWK